MVFGQVLFEVILAVALDFIGNIVKEAAAITARLAARVTTGIVDALQRALTSPGEVSPFRARRSGTILRPRFFNVAF